MTAAGSGRGEIDRGEQGQAWRLGPGRRTGLLSALALGRNGHHICNALYEPGMVAGTMKGHLSDILSGRELAILKMRRQAQRGYVVTQQGVADQVFNFRPLGFRSPYSSGKSHREGTFHRTRHACPRVWIHPRSWGLGTKCACCPGSSLGSSLVLL